MIDALNRRSARTSVSTAAATGVTTDVQNDENTKIEERRSRRLIMAIGLALCGRGAERKETD